MSDAGRNVDDVHHLASDVHGWLTEREGEVLYGLARNNDVRDAVIVEIGSWKGRSTLYLAGGSMAGSGVAVYAIDPHNGSRIHQELFGKVATFDEFKANVRRAGADAVVRPLVMTSQQAALEFKEPVALLFIDGEHEYPSVRRDFELWSPKVIDGGCIAFHDSRKPGPRRLIAEAVLSSRRFRELHSVDSLTVVRKVARNSAVDRLRNHLAFRTYLLKKLAS